MTDPLPLVPATMTEWKLFSGWPSAAQIRRMFSRPNFIPRRSSEKRNSRGKTCFSSWRRPRVRALRLDRLLDRRRGAEAEDAGDEVLHLASIDDDVEHAVLEQKLAALESFGQRLADGLLDDARAGESDEGFRLGDVDVAEHREARRDAAGRRIGQDRDVGELRAIQTGQAGADLGHLHQRQRAFHHARAAGARHDDERHAPGDGTLDRPGDLLSDDDAHAAADERVFHGRDDGLDAVDAALSGDHRIVEAGGGDAGVEPLVIRLGIGELERVGGCQPAVEFLPLTVVEHPQPLRGAQPEVVPAFRADTQASDEILVVDDLRAGGAFDPETFGYPALLVGWLNGLSLLLEPGHSGKTITAMLSAEC